MKTEFVPEIWSPPCPRCEGGAYEYRDTRTYKEPGSPPETLSLIECLWCGETTFTPWQPEELPEDLKSSDKDFVFAQGRFSGKTIADVSTSEDGRGYLQLILEGSLSVGDDCLQAVKQFHAA